MEKGHLDEKEILENFHEKNSGLFGVNEELKNTKEELEEIKKELENKKELLKEKDKSLKKFTYTVGITISLSAAAIVSVGTYATYIRNKYNQEINKISTIYDNLQETCNIENANYEVLDAYMKYASKEYEKSMPYDETTVKEQIDAFNNTYYIPAKTAIDNYRDCKEEEKEYYYNQFRKNTKIFNDAIKEQRENLEFSNTIFKYAKFINGEVCVPTTDIIDSSVLSEEQVIDPDDGKTIYVPVNTLSEDEIKNLGK